MSRVEWAALSGEEVETVVANLLYNEHPRAVRIRPAQGDYGVDVLVPCNTKSDRWDVYQIKKFATTLDESHKRQIKDSFRRLLIGLARQGLPIEDWYLVMPLDPTLDNRLQWFKSMPQTVMSAMFSDATLALTDEEKRTITIWHDAPGRIIDWKGLNDCQVMAAKYWYVPDYYLHGGSERIRAAVAEVTKILQRDLALPDATNSPATSVLQPSDIVEHLRRLQQALDGDPHFRYGISFDPHPPQILDEPGLVAATQQIDPDDSCLTFRIYARFAEAVNERPVPIKLTFNAEDPAFDQRAFDMWRRYGTALTAPVKYDADLPGGLDHEIVNATVHITPSGGSQDFERRVRIRTPDGTPGPALTLSLSSATGLDGSGAHIQGSDRSGLVHVQWLINADDLSGTFTFSLGDLDGAEAAAALPAAEFLAELAHPNTLQIANRYGPFHDAFPIPYTEPLIPPVVLRYLRALTAIQSRVATPVLVPDLGAVYGADVQAAVHAAALIESGTVVRNWRELTYEANPATAIDPEAEYQLLTVERLTLALGTDTLFIGVVHNTLLSARLSPVEQGKVQALPYSNNTAHSVLLNDAADVPGPRTRVFARIISGSGDRENQPA